MSKKLMQKEDLIKNIDKLHITSLGIIRVKKNLGIDSDILSYCKKVIKNHKSKVIKYGKNYYCSGLNICITINASSYTIITAHII